MPQEFWSAWRGDVCCHLTPKCIIASCNPYKVLNSSLQTKRAKLARFLQNWNLCNLSQSKFKYLSYTIWCFLKCPQITDSPFKIKTCLARHHPKPECWLQTNLTTRDPTGLGQTKSAPHAPKISPIVRVFSTLPHKSSGPSTNANHKIMAGKNGRLHYVALSDAAKRREAGCFRFEQLIKLTIPCGHWNVRWPASIHAPVFVDSLHKFKIPCSAPITEKYIWKYMRHVFVRVCRHASMWRLGSTKYIHKKCMHSICQPDNLIQTK